MTTDNFPPFTDARTDEARHNRTAWTWGHRGPKTAPTSAEANPADFPGFLEQVAMSTGNADRAAVLMAQANLHATQNVERALERMTTRLVAAMEAQTKAELSGHAATHARLGTLQETVVEASSAAAQTVVDSLEEVTEDETPRWTVQVGDETEANVPPSVLRPYAHGPKAALPIVAKIDGGPSFLVTAWQVVNDEWTLTTEPIPDAAPVEVSAEFVGQPVGPNLQTEKAAAHDAAQAEDTRDYSGVHDYVADDEDVLVTDAKIDRQEEDVIPQGDAHEAASARRAENLAADEAAGQAFREAAENAVKDARIWTSEEMSARIGPTRSWPSADTTTPVDDALAESVAVMPNVTWPSSAAEAGDHAVLGTFRDHLERRRMANSYVLGMEEGIRLHVTDEAVDKATAAFQMAMGWPDGTPTPETTKAIREAIVAFIMKDNG